MHTTRAQLKEQARSMLPGIRFALAGLTATFAFFNLTLSALLDLFFADSTGGFGFLLKLVSSALANMVFYFLLAGRQKIYLALCQRRPLFMNDMFFAFSHRTEAVAVYSLIPFVLNTATATLFSYTSTQFLLVWMRTGNVPYAAASVFPYIAASLLIRLVSAVIQLWFFPVLFLYCEAPWKNAGMLMGESFRLMRGHKRELFCLELSFLGLDLLSILSFGIGTLFAEPYRQVTLTLFYIQLNSQTEYSAS